MAKALAAAGIICNFNMVPGDPRKPFVTSGVRMGTPALTSMGMQEPEMDLIAGWIDDVFRHMEDLDETTGRIRAEIADLCARFPIPGIRGDR
jgi:glycine hydroxymethyltransferase